MGKLLHLLLSIQRGGLSARGMGKLRHLLSSIQRRQSMGICSHLLSSTPLGRRMGKFVIHVRLFSGGRVWVSFVICSRRSSGGGGGEDTGKFRHLLSSIPRGRGMDNLRHLLSSIQGRGGEEVVRAR